ncbi:MAG: hypothetical protein KC493_16460 [Bacteriovoracaceae bacterium]|nr:hypothetical protein [Bacteriovoracaceae bacterium]
MKKIIISAFILISTAFAQDVTVGSKGESTISLSDIHTGGRVVDDIHTGGRVINLMKLERISGSSKFILKDARPMITNMMSTNGNADTVVRMMKLKLMADFKDIEEITLKDGTVLKAEDILRGN